MTKKILLIGGGGYIGSRLYHDLSDLHHITSVDISWFETINVHRIIDYKNITAEEIQLFDVVILLAGHSSVKMCGEFDRPASWKNNVLNFQTLLQKIRQDQLLIYASSSSVYGNSSSDGIESSTLHFTPINNYDLTKFVIDLIAADHIARGYKLIGLRFGTVNGWSPVMRNDLMINAMTMSGINDRKTVHAINPSMMRPILGISDLVRVIDAIITNPLPGIYNVASFNDSVLHIAQKACTMLGASLNVNVESPITYNFMANTTKFRDSYNFEFHCTTESIINDILQHMNNKTIVTYRTNFKEYE